MVLIAREAFTFRSSGLVLSFTPGSVVPEVAVPRCEEQRARLLRAAAPEEMCEGTAECGAACGLLRGHTPPCLCSDDEDGCPA
jgi:hypothetical protein